MHLIAKNNPFIDHKTPTLLFVIANNVEDEIATSYAVGSLSPKFITLVYHLRLSLRATSQTR